MMRRFWDLVLMKKTELGGYGQSSAIITGCAVLQSADGNSNAFLKH